MNAQRSFFHRLRLRHVVFIVLLLSGIIPLAVSSQFLIQQNRQLLEERVEEELLRTANSLSREIDGSLAAVRRQLVQLGGQVLAFGSGADLERRLRRSQVEAYLERLIAENPELIILRLLTPEGQGYGPMNPPPEVETVLLTTFDAAVVEDRAAYAFGVLPGSGEPVAAMTVPVSLEGEGRLLPQALASLRLLDRVFRREVSGEVEVLLFDADENLLWSQGSSPESIEALLDSEMVGQLVRTPVNMVTSYPGAGDRKMLLWASQVPESGWTVVVQRPRATAFPEIDRMALNSVLSSLLLVALALLFALLAARRVSQPIQRLAETSHEIADGNFGRRVETSGLLFELADLGRDFNRMGVHVERYVEELRRAAQANRDLFIGSLRAFAAAIDAKDPYTRGHSERVASVARAIGRQLGLSDQKQDTLWIAALLHDVGKIGVDDRILQKVGQLDPEELEKMKEHPVIGAEILEPIEQLREMIPAVRWHHENWNGRGYPDGLKGDETPLIARIVAVADTFDALTTTRPYQQAFAYEAAMETLTRLAGSRFDAKVVTAFLKAVEIGRVKVETRPATGPVEERTLSEVEARVLSMS